MWERINPLPHRRFPIALQQMTFENIVATEENTQNEKFLLLPHTTFPPLFSYCSFVLEFSNLCQDTANLQQTTLKMFTEN